MGKNKEQTTTAGKNTIDTLLWHMDFTHDLDRVIFIDQLKFVNDIYVVLMYPERCEESLKDILKDAYRVAEGNMLTLLLPIPKHLLRGGIVGALEGALMGVVKGEPVRYALAGAALGGSVDFFQYYLRAFYKLIQAQICGGKP